MYKFKLSKPLSASSIIWALLVTAVVLLIASGASAQEETLPPPPPPVVEAPPVVVPPSSPEPAPPTVAPTGPVNETPAALSEPVNPDDNGTGDTRASELQTRLAEVAERRAAIEEKRAALQSASSSRQALLSADIQERAFNGIARVNNVLSTSINRTRELTIRLRDRAGALALNGAEVNNILSLLDQADKHLDLAGEALKDMDVNARYAITSDQPQNDWQDVKSQFSTVRQALRDAHLLLRSAAGSMRGLIADPNPPITPSQQ